MDAATTNAPIPSMLRRRAPFEKRRWRWGLFVGGWMALGILIVTPHYLYLAIQQNTSTTSVEPADRAPVVTETAPARATLKAERESKDRFHWAQPVSQLLDWYLWLLVLPLIWWVVGTYPFERKGLLRWLAINLSVGVMITSLFSLLTLAKNQLILNIGRGDLFSTGMFHSWRGYLLNSLEFFIVPYFFILAAIHAVRYYQKYNARELKTSHLKMQLAEAKLETLRMQLHPHFLFNTLNAISALMHSDVEAADGMISRLSDLLRLSLDHDDRHVVPLREELAFLDRYVGIEMIRFRGRLTVEINVAPECLNAQVPKLILQPLVENAIRHGIAHSATAGHVTVRGRRQDGRLLMQVVDDGPGLPGGRLVREGVGLSNTRARLVQLYGKDHTFTPRNAESGGFEALFEIPFEHEDRVLSGVFQRPGAERSERPSLWSPVLPH